MTAMSDPMPAADVSFDAGSRSGFPLRQGRRPLVWAVVLGVPLLLLVAMATRGQAAAVTFDNVALSLVPSQGTTSQNAVDPSGKDYDEIAGALGTSDPTTYGSEVVVLPEGMMTVPMGTAQVQLSHAVGSTDTGSRSISIIGMSNFTDTTTTDLIEQVEVMAIITWSTAGDTNPATAVVFRSSSQLLSEWVPVPTGQDPQLEQALLGLRRPISGNDTADRLFSVLDLPPAAQTFLDDGVATTGTDAGAGF